MSAEIPALDGRPDCFSDFLRHIANNSQNDQVLTIFNEAERMVVSSKGHEAPSRLHKRKRHLLDYYNLMKAKFQFECDAIEDPLDLPAKSRLDQLAFPLDERKMIEKLQTYLAVAMKYVKGQFLETDKPRFDTLKEMRDSLLHHVNTRYWEAGREPPSQARLLNYTNEVLRKCGEEYGVNQAAARKPYLGRFELAQLIDWDSLRSARSAVTEVHHLAWCMAHQCGVRPSSLTISDLDHPTNFMRWKHVRVVRSEKRGHFDCYLDFVNLKTSMDDLSFTLDKSLKMRPKSPLSTAYIPQSIPHRILVMILRRDALPAYPASAASSFEDRVLKLMNGQEHFIKIHEGFAEKPVFEGWTPWNRTTNGKPIPARALTEYLERRARAVGYGLGVTLYAFRRQTATEWQRQLGLNQARQLMNHAPDTTTLMRYYEKGSSNIDVTAVALSEREGASYQQMDLVDSVALTRLIDIAKCQGKFLNDYVSKACEQNVALQEALKKGDEHTARNIKRRTREFAKTVLEEQQRTQETYKLTQKEWESRKRELVEPTTLVKLVHAKAAPLRKPPAKKLVENASLRAEDLRDQNDPDLQDAEVIVDEGVGKDEEGAVSWVRRFDAHKHWTAPNVCWILP